MKENPIFMHYPDNTLPIRFDPNRMELNETGFQRLAGFWRGTAFLCTSWRFYYNDTEGGAVLVDGQWYELEPDKIYLLAPGCEFKTRVKNNPHQFYMHFSLSHHGGFLTDPLFILPLDTVSQDFMIQSLNNPQRGFILCTQLIFHTLSRLPESVFTGRRMDARIGESIRYMSRSLDHDISVVNLSKRHDLSDGAFSRLFRQETGQSPYAFLIGMRMEQASNLLRITDRSIEEIATLCGFRDRFHFSRTFKKQTNRNPGEFRR